MYCIGLAYGYVLAVIPWGDAPTGYVSGLWPSFVGSEIGV